MIGEATEKAYVDVLSQKDNMPALSVLLHIVVGERDEERITPVIVCSAVETERRIPNANVYDVNIEIMLRANLNDVSAEEVNAVWSWLQSIATDPGFQLCAELSQNQPIDVRNVEYQQAETDQDQSHYERKLSLITTLIYQP